MKASLAPQDKINLIEQISKLFDGKKIEELARETNFIQRQGILSGMDFFFLCVFAHQQNHEISLEGLCAELLKDNKNITKQSLQDRFNDNAVAFMQETVSIALSQKLNTQIIIPHPVFARIIIGDSTVFQLPGHFSGKYAGSGGDASKASVKVQYGYDLLTQNILVMLVQEGIRSDNNQELIDVKKTIYG